MMQYVVMNEDGFYWDGIDWVDDIDDARYYNDKEEAIAEAREQSEDGPPDSSVITVEEVA